MHYFIGREGQLDTRGGGEGEGGSAKIWFLYSLQPVNYQQFNHLLNLVCLAPMTSQGRRGGIKYPRGDPE